MASGGVQAAMDGYLVTQWVTFSYYTSEQLQGQYTPLAIPSGYTYRLIGCFPIFDNTPMAAKFSGKFLSAANNTIRALGTGFVSTDEETLLVCFNVYKE